MWDGFEEYLTYLEVDKGVSQSTLDVRERSLKGFQAFAEEQGVTSAEGVTRRLIARYVDHLVEEGYAYHTIMESRYSSVGAAIQYLYREREISENVMDRIDRQAIKSKAEAAKSEAEKKAENGPPVHLSKEEVYEMAANAKPPSDRNELLIKLMFWTGVRASELVGIDRYDIEEDKPKITVYSPKTGESRPVSYPKAEINPLLRDWINNGRLRYKCADDSDKLFIGPKGPIGTNVVNKIVKQSAENAGIQTPGRVAKDGREFSETTSHILRHSHAMHYLNEEEVPIEQISDHLGHSDVNVTKEFYASSTEDTIVDTFGG